MTLIIFAIAWLLGAATGACAMAYFCARQRETRQNAARRKIEAYLSACAADVDALPGRPQALVDYIAEHHSHLN